MKRKFEKGEVIWVNGRSDLFRFVEYSQSEKYCIIEYFTKSQIVENPADLCHVKMIHFTDAEIEKFLNSVFDSHRNNGDSFTVFGELCDNTIIKKSMSDLFLRIFSNDDKISELQNYLDYQNTYENRKYFVCRLNEGVYRIRGYIITD